MADLSDITAYLASAVAAAVYPNGNSSPSIAPVPVGYSSPADVRVYEGWPLPEQLDLDLAGKVLAGVPPVLQPRSNGPCPNISVYPLPGATRGPYQVLDKTYVITPPVYGLVVSVSGNEITLTGTPGAGEFLTLVCDRQFIYSATGARASAILSALATQASANYEGVGVVGDVLTVPADFSLVVRQGAVGTLGKVTHRQCQEIMVTVWAPDHATRSVLARTVDAVLKSTIVVTLPDTSEAKIVYSRTNQSDEGQNVTAYRRDLIYEVEYATLETFPGVTITSVTTDIAASEYQYPTLPPAVPAVT